MQTKSFEERLAQYKNRYHIDITDISDIEFRSRMPLSSIDYYVFYN